MRSDLKNMGLVVSIGVLVLVLCAGIENASCGRAPGSEEYPLAGWENVSGGGHRTNPETPHAPKFQTPAAAAQSSGNTVNIGAGAQVVSGGIKLDNLEQQGYVKRDVVPPHTVVFQGDPTTFFKVVDSRDAPRVIGPPPSMEGADNPRVIGPPAASSDKVDFRKLISDEVDYR